MVCWISYNRITDLLMGPRSWFSHVAAHLLTI